MDDTPSSLGSDLPAHLLAAVEAQAGLSLSDVPREILAFAVERSKSAGNAAFGEGNYREAARLYTQAIAGDPTDKTLFSNRSAASLAMGLHDDALRDAVTCVRLDDRWPKAHYRLGAALMAVGEWRGAVDALEIGARLAPGNRDVDERLKTAREKARDEAERATTQVAARRRDLAYRFREARRADARNAILTQWKQTMSGPEWDVEDYEWRPTFLPLMRTRLADMRRFESDPRRAGMLRFAASVAELETPKRTMKVFDDSRRLNAYARATARVSPGKRVLTIANGGGGILAMCARAAGAMEVHVVERNRFLYRMAKQCIRSNSKNNEKAPPIHLIDQRLELCRADDASTRDAGAQEDPSPEMNEDDALEAVNNIRHTEEASVEIDATVPPADIPDSGLATVMPGPADVILTDLFDHAGGLGLGILPAIDHAGAHLAHTASVVLPGRLKIKAVLLEIRIDQVCGFDLRSLNAYRWHPQAASIDLASEPHRVLSAPFDAADLNLTERLRKAAVNRAAGHTPNETDRSDRPRGGAADWEHDINLTIEATETGVWNAVAFWFEADMGDGEFLRSCPHPSRSQKSNASADSNSRTTKDVLDPASDSPRLFDANSWGTAVQYLDELGVEAGESVEVRVRQDATQILFVSSPPQTRPRHAHIPHWHYDMLNDANRNDAYDAAISAAVHRRKASGGRVEVLDAGAGSGILSMMAARAGADFVTAVEQATHMTDAGEEAVCMNGYGDKVLCLNRDVRRVFTKESEGVVRGALKPDGTTVEMERPVDLMVYEVFDSGLIGEGVLHILATARRRLLKGDASLVPARATVYAQVVEMRTSTVHCGGDVGSDVDSFSDGNAAVNMSFDMSHANRWRWRSDYEGVNLEKCRDKWQPLGDPVKVFDFDFYDVCRDNLLQPEVSNLDVKVTAGGVFNAVAFWFELHLDDTTSVSTSPHDGTKGQTWQQALQYLEEMRVAPGDVLPIVASHDTYSISFAVDDGRLKDRAERRTGVPLYDPVWAVQHEHVKRINDDLARVIAQSPLEYRTAAETAVAMGARPFDLGLDAEAGAEFCLRMMQ